MANIPARNIASANVHLKVLRIAYTPDSDDVFNYYAWEHDRITLDPAEFQRGHISELNQAALEESYDVVAFSSAVFPLLADRFWILATGNSVGRSFGPVLASKRYCSTAELHGKRVVVAGTLTTGGVLAQMYCPEARFVKMPYTRIADAILRDECDAGVMIHEEIFHFPKLNLNRMCSFAQVWQEETGLSLPVGLNLVRKKLGKCNISRKTS